MDEDAPKGVYHCEGNEDNVRSGSASAGVDEPQQVDVRTDAEVLT